MKITISMFIFICLCMLGIGCSGPAKYLIDVELGMNREEVREIMGDPYTIRAAKAYEGGEWMQAWEYLPPLLSLNPKTYWIFFENDSVVQWGEPGDFTGKEVVGIPVAKPSKRKNIR